ncbi:hypothetical protein AB0C06_03110 [Micromonospora inaquosa]|uniref:hypothetical protein n=1 Tax=Micromonospora inaquosa TaxID=2203716 RepID=UPI003404562C
MHNGEEEELRRIREFLFADRADADPQTPDHSRLLIDQALKKDAERESAMRALGYNRVERERWRQNKSVPKPRSGDRDRAIAVKRIDHYIGTRVNWTSTSLNRAEVVAAWANLSNHDVDRVKAWLDKGVDPLRFAEVIKLLDNGLRPDDIFTEVHGKTIAQHLRDGSSVEWCLHALHFKQERDSSTRPVRPQSYGAAPSARRTQ